MPKGGGGGLSSQAAGAVRRAYQSGGITRARANAIGRQIQRLADEGASASAQREAALTALGGTTTPTRRARVRR